MTTEATLPETRSDPPDFLADGGEMGALMRAHDWAATPLGPPDAWPQSLRTVVRIVLTSRYAMWMAWGPELIFFCNDAYRPTLGVKQGWALGAPAREVWAEIWPDIGPRIERVLRTGEATWDEGLLLFLERRGFSEETYHTFSYSPLPGDSSGVAGMLCVVTEETERVIGERRLALLSAVAAEIAPAKTEAEVFASLGRALDADARDLPFTLVYLFEEDGTRAQLAYAAGIASDHPAVPGTMEVGAACVFWPAATVLEAEVEAVEVDTPAARFGGAGVYGGLPMGPWDRPPERALLVPIAQQGQARPAGFLVAGINPHRLLDAEYRRFLGLLAGQVAAGLANARAYGEERRRAEALAELDRAKTAFFANVSHEFRTPLTLMLGPLEESLAAAEQLLPEERERVEMAHRNALRLLRLVNSLLDFSRVEAGRMQAHYVPTNLAALTAELASSFRSLCERAGLTLEVDCPPLPKVSFVDQDMWEKVVLNLLSNAFKFTFRGGISVALHPSADGAAAELTVRDTGTGIPADELPHLFERFHRVEGARGRSYEGSGIGLALVRELVHLHGGEIRAESEPGHGAIFTVTVPLGMAHLPADRLGKERTPAPMTARAQAYVEEALRWLPDADGPPGGTGVDILSSPSFSDDVLAPVAPIGTWGRGRVLLADDNADMRGYVRRLLVEQGYEVEAVPDGEAALDAARRHAPDLVLSDVMMPRLDGFGLLRALRAEPMLAELPVILLSARAGEEARVEGLNAGADDYLTKPFSARELLARIGAGLSLARVRREAAEAMRTHSAELATVLATVPAAVWFTRDPQAGQVWGNRRAAELLRLPEGANASLTAPAAERPSFRVFRGGTEAAPETLPIQRAARGEEVRGDEQEVRFSDGAPSTFLLCHATPLRDGEGNVAGAVCAAVDITERRRAEEALRASEQRLDAVLDNASVAVFLMDDRQQCIYMNAAAERLTGYTLAEVQDRPLHDVIHHTRPDGSHFSLSECSIDRAFPERVRMQGEEVFIHKDGTFYPVAFTASPIRNAETDALVGTVVEARDIRAEKDAQVALAEAAETREALLHEVNHRVKNSLQLVSSLLSLQASRSADPDLRMGLAEARGRIGVVSQVHRRLYQAGTHGRIDDLAGFLRELCTDTVTALDPEGRIRIEFAEPGEDGAAVPAPIDKAVPLALVISELVTNAVKYAFPDGREGTIRVLLRRTLDVEGAGLVVSVEDDGVGLPEGFDPAVSRGIGMRVVATLARQLRARLRVGHAAPGGGAAFEIALPWPQPKADAAASRGDAT